MSKKNNINPDHYKIAGRDRQGEDILQQVHKQKYAQAQGKGSPKEAFFPASPRPKNDSETSKTTKAGK